MKILSIFSLILLSSLVRKRSMKKMMVNYLKIIRSTTIISVVNKIKSTSAPQSMPILDMMTSPDVIYLGLVSRVL